VRNKAISDKDQEEVQKTARVAPKKGEGVNGRSEGVRGDWGVKT